MSIPSDYFKLIDFRARSLVCGTRVNEQTGKSEPNTGHLAHDFAKHLLCQRAVREGWLRELTGHLVMAVKAKLKANQDIGDVGHLMPDAEWIRATAENAAKANAAAEWRKEVIAEHGIMDNFLQKTARGFVAKSQPNASVPVRRVLTETSRRMSAEHE